VVDVVVVVLVVVDVVVTGAALPELEVSR